MLLSLLVLPLARSQSAMVDPQAQIGLALVGTVRAIARDSQGRVIIGGDFSEVNGVARRNLARLLPDGSVDPTWQVFASSGFRGLTVDAQDRVYVYGESFGQGAGPFSFSRSPSRVLADGTLDPAWESDSRNEITDVAITPDGDIFAAGLVYVLNGQERRDVARLDPATGALDLSWSASVMPSSYPLRVLDLQAGPGDALWIAGNFVQVNGVNRFGLAKLVAGTGALDPGFEANTNLQPVTRIAPGANGSLYVAGSFDSVNGVPVPRIAKIDALTGSVDPLWNPVTAGDCQSSCSVASDGQGDVYISGRFTGVSGSERVAIAKVRADGVGSLVWDWDAQLAAGSAVDAVLPQPMGEVIVGGRFLEASGQPLASLLQLRVNAQLGSFAPRVGINERFEASGEILRVHGDALLYDDIGDLLYVGGRFELVNGVRIDNLARLRRGRELDTAWRPQPDEGVHGLARATDGNLFVAGAFDRIGARERPALAKLAISGTGEAIASFDAGFSGALTLRDIASLQVSGERAVGVVGAAAAVDIVREVDGARLAGFAPPVIAWPAGTPRLERIIAGPVTAAAQPTFFIGGQFDRANGVPRESLIQVDAASGVVLPFRAFVRLGDTLGTVAALHFDAAGNHLYVGGDFDGLNGTSRIALGRFDLVQDQLDAGWNVGLHSVQSLRTSLRGLLLDTFENRLYLAGNMYLGSNFRFFGLQRVTASSGLLDPYWNVPMDNNRPGLRSIARVGDAMIGGGDFVWPLSAELAHNSGVVVVSSPLSSIFGDGFETW